MTTRTLQDIVDAAINWEPLPIKMHVDGIKSDDAQALLREAEDAIRGVSA